MRALTKTFLLGVAVLAGISASQSATAASTASGIDTLGTSQIFAVQGDKVGDWDKNQLSVTGAVVASGTVQVGQTTAACGPRNPGAQRFNATSRQLEYCDGIGPEWKTMGSSPSGTWCGQYFSYETNTANSDMRGGAVVYSVIKSCGGDSEAVYSGNSLGAPTPITKILVSCPTDYTLTPAGVYNPKVYGGDVPLEGAGKGESQTTYTYSLSYTALYTCMKD